MYQVRNHLQRCFDIYTRPVGQAVKTAASHAANMGSIPVRVTKVFLDMGLKSEYTVFVTAIAVSIVGAD